MGCRSTTRHSSYAAKIQASTEEAYCLLSVSECLKLLAQGETDERLCERTTDLPVMSEGIDDAA